MTYSRRQLYAFGEPLGNSATRNKIGGGRIYGGGGGGDIVSDIVDPVSDVIDTVGDVAQTVVDTAATVVETAANTVANTAQAIVNDPTKALPLIAVAVLAPELAPLLEVSTATAGAIINTGMALANGADPTQVAENFATSMATGSLGITTGTGITDRMLVGGVNAALNGQDVATGVGTALGNYAVSSAANAGVSEVRNAGGDNSDIDPATGQPWTGSDQSSTVSSTAGVTDQQITGSQIFQDAVNAGFSKEDAYNIAKVQLEPSMVGSAMAPLASNGTVTVEGAPASDAYGPSTPVTYNSLSKEDLAKELGDGEIDQATYDALLPYASDLTKSEQEYVDPLKEFSPIDATDAKPTEPSTSPTNNFSGVLGTETNENGHVVSTFDDGSTLTYDPETQEVVDFTEATDYQDPNPEDTSETKGGLSIGLGKASSQAKTLRKTTGKTPSGTTPSGATDTSGLSGLGTSYGSNLTQSTSSGNPEYSLFGEIAPQEGMASGGAVQHMATGSTPDTSAQGVYDLSTTASSPFLGGGNQSIMALKPQVIKGKINYALPGYPFGQEWKLAAEGGAIQNAPEGHNPEFFSEGGLNSLQHTYLKGGGDGTSDSIPAMLANGEFVIPADVVSSLGNGSSDSGAKVLDEFLKTIRAHKRKADPKKLPPDSKGVKGYLLEAKKKVKK